MKRGRKPKPTALHELNGNPSKLDLNEIKEKTIKVNPGMPICPDYLDAVGKSKWNEIVGELGPIGILCKVDGAALEACCQTYSVMVKAAQVINAPGSSMTMPTQNGGNQQITELGIYNRAAALYKSYMAEFGMSPSSRTRLEYPEGEPRPAAAADQKKKGPKSLDEIIDIQFDKTKLKHLKKTKHGDQNKTIN